MHRRKLASSSACCGCARFVCLTHCALPTLSFTTGCEDHSSAHKAARVRARKVRAVLARDAQRGGRQDLRRRQGSGATRPAPQGLYRARVPRHTPAGTSHHFRAVEAAVWRIVPNKHSGESAPECVHGSGLWSICPFIIRGKCTDERKNACRRLRLACAHSLGAPAAAFCRSEVKL